MAIQSNNNNLNYLIDPTFTKVNRFFFFSLARNARWDHFFFFTFICTKRRNKRFQCFDWWQNILWLAGKNEEGSYDKIIEMSKNIDYATGNLLDFAYFKENYRLIAIDLSKQTKLNADSKWLERQGNNINEATIFLSLKNEKKLLLNFYKILWKSYKNWKRKRF